MKENSYGIIPYLFKPKGVYILMYKTSKKSKNWNFIKGKPDGKETIEETVKREVFEEIGVKVYKKDFENYYFHTSSKKDIGLYMINFDKYLKKKIKIDKREIGVLKWVKVSKIKDISKNQELFYTDILNRFAYLDFLRNKSFFQQTKTTKRIKNV